jgi:caspase domain-containing protein
MPKRPIRSLVFLVVTIAGTSFAQENRQLVQKPPSQETKPSPQRRMALVIGNGAYINASWLTNPSNDAQDMAFVLRSLGFELVGGGARLNQSADQMKQLIKDLGEKLSHGGVGLFYYAGHGVQAEGHNYLIPVDANILREKTLEFDTVDVNRVLAEMDGAGNGFNIVILDACRNNPFARSWRSADQGLAQINAPEGTLIAYATSPGRIASDGTGRNGTYTAELLRQMRVPKLSIEEMFKAVRAGVKAATKNQQTPWEASSLVGAFCFVGDCTNPGTKGLPSNSDSSLLEPAAFELSYWDSIKTSSNIEDFKSYLEKYPNGQFSSLAKNRIASLSTETKVPDANKASSMADTIELAYWDSIKNSSDTEDFKSYLEKYPRGQFVDLARRRAEVKTGTPPTNSSETSKFFQITTKVRADSTTNGWTNSGLVVRFGQRIRISASGRISLGSGISSAPEGLTNLTDLKKLMKSQPTGGVIAAIGDDNDDFIFIGRNRDFVAPHDGVLFLGVNEGNLTDNSGAFDIVIEAESVSLQSSAKVVSGSGSPKFFQINVRVRGDNASNGWTNSGLVVRRGQRLRISASGRVSLGTNRFATPDGLANITDRDKLMRTQPTGGLIAVIGDDNDEFIFIGRVHDFVAQRNGVLFLGVNEGDLKDNTGAFEVVIEAEALAQGKHFEFRRQRESGEVADWSASVLACRTETPDPAECKRGRLRSSGRFALPPAPITQQVANLRYITRITHS